jgi:hypothetical protein
MKKELLTLTPQEFCDAAEACPEGREFALTHSTMAVVWDDCYRVDWLLWALGRLEAGGLPDFARWCADRARAAADAAAARWPDSDAARWAAAPHRWAADSAASAASFSGWAAADAAAADEAARAAAAADPDDALAVVISGWAAATRGAYTDAAERRAYAAEIKRRWGNPFLQSQR